GRRRGAERALEVRRAEPAKQPRRQRALGQPAVRAAVVVRQDRLAARPRADRLEPRRDAVERVVPRDRRELAAALGAGAEQRRGQPVLAVEVIGDLADLAAHEAIGERAAAVAVDLDHAAVVDGDEQAAQVGAVERTGTGTDLHGGPLYAGPG